MASNIYRPDDAQIREAGDLRVENFITRSNSDALSVSVATLSGHHPISTSERCERVYVIIEGVGEVWLDGVSSHVGPGDVVHIAKNTSHGIDGNLKYVLINSPAFDPSKE